MNIEIIPSIAIFAYIIAEIYKKIFKKKYYKFIPLVLSAIGGLIGELIFLIEYGFIALPINIEFVVIGALSGLSATGTNQIFEKLIIK